MSALAAVEVNLTTSFSRPMKAVSLLRSPYSAHHSINDSDEFAVSSISFDSTLTATFSTLLARDHKSLAASDKMAHRQRDIYDARGKTR